MPPAPVCNGVRLGAYCLEMPLVPPKRTSLSRRPLALALAACMLVAGLVVPQALHLPRWVEIELVLAAWWLTWCAVLFWILYRGSEVEDDADVEFATHRTRSAIQWTFGLGDSCCWFNEIGIAVFAVIVALLAVFFLVELAAPAVALLLFLSIGGMVARAVNDRHDCEGRVGPSLLWAVLWSTVYLGPASALAAWLSKFIGA